jgi:hypothetical protein
VHRKRKRVSGRRLLSAAGFLAALAALCLAVTSFTLARSTASETSTTSSFTAGTVTLTASAIAGCPVSGLLPNNTPGAACTFTATYGGSVPAYLAVNVLVETQAGAGGTSLYNPADSANDLQITVTSSGPSVGYTVPTAASTCPAGAPPGSGCYELDNELVGTRPFSSASVTFSVSAKLPLSSSTGYQGGTAQIILTAHAVQSANNTLSCSSTPAAGSACTPSGSFTWS